MLITLAFMLFLQLGSYTKKESTTASIKKMILLLYALIGITAVGVSCFLLNDYLEKKLVIFIFSILSLAGLVLSVLNGQQDLTPWLICSLPLITYLIYIAIFRGKK